MKDKAKGNIIVARALLNKSDSCYCNASIHCSYYAVLQYMKYMLAHTTRCPIAYEEQDSSCGSDSHNFILQNVQNRITDPRNARNFAQKVRDLKNIRITADYHIEIVHQERGLECLDKAENCIANLKQYFGNI